MTGFLIPLRWAFLSNCQLSVIIILSFFVSSVILWLWLVWFFDLAIFYVSTGWWMRWWVWMNRWMDGCISVYLGLNQEREKKEGIRLDDKVMVVLLTNRIGLKLHLASILDNCKRAVTHIECILFIATIPDKLFPYFFLFSLFFLYFSPCWFHSLLSFCSLFITSWLIVLVYLSSMSLNQINNSRVKHSSIWLIPLLVHKQVRENRKKKGV